MVIKKGDPSCNVLLRILTEKDHALSQNLGITAKLSLPTQEQNKNTAQPTQPGIASLQPSAPVEPPLEGQASQQECQVTKCTETEFKKIMSEDNIIYPIREKGKRKRLALIICNTKFDDGLQEREGANADIEGMKQLLKELDYNVHCKMNLTAEKMRTAMKDFASDHHHEDSDSTFLVFMSHGERDIICGTDFKKEKVEGQERVTGGLHVDFIFNTFNSVNCSRLRDKPKIIIIQACRGNEDGRVWVCDGAQQPPNITEEDRKQITENIKDEDLENDAMYKSLKEKDFICFYSTTPDTLSYRHISSGSLFIQRLIKVLKEDAHNSSIEDMFQKVQRSFENDRQMPTKDRTSLVKKFFLCPGY
ncbi:caspase-1-A-like isoform X1 [Hyla sarda]|nr:caspase-1-A-like isoform X1 [Hyla sarda]